MAIRDLVIGMTMFLSGVAAADTATPTAADQKEDIRVLGKLNVNQATREQLLTVPGLTAPKVDALLGQREKGPIEDLAPFALPADATAHLKTEGDSDYRRIRRLPLQVVGAVHTAHR